MTHLKKFWLTYGAFFTAFLYFLLPSIQAYVAAHPNTSFSVLLTAVVVASHLRSPWTPSTPK